MRMTVLNITDTITPEGERFQQMLEELSRLEVRVGFQAGEAAEEDGTDVCSVAAWNELGGGNIPSRPFLRQSVDNHQAEILSFIKAMKAELVSGNASAEDILNRIGVFQKGIIQQEIASGSFAPNAPSTIARKGSSRPLIDTGRMRQSVNYVVQEKGSGD